MKSWKSIAAAALIAIPATIAHAGGRDLVSTADATGKFAGLLEAAEVAGLLDTLKGQGPYTVFAPTDEAFDKLDPDFVEYLSQPENREELAALLKKHIVPGKILAADLKGTSEPMSTLLDTRLQVDTSSGIRVGDARLTASDILASNGVIHAIDSLIDKNGL